MMPGPMMGHPMSGPMVGQRNFPTLYVGDLDEAVTEEMLYNFFIKYGPIYSVRIMRDLQNKKSRGFAFLSYYNIRDAENAKTNSNHEYILSNPIRVTWKKNLRELSTEFNIFIKNLDPSITVADIDSTFSQFGTIFTSKLSMDEKGNSRGYGYVQFESKESAERAIAEASNLRIRDLPVEINSF
jgi:polyadenylate-binding protein